MHTSHWSSLLYIYEIYNTLTMRWCKVYVDPCLRAISQFQMAAITAIPQNKRTAEVERDKNHQRPTVLEMPTGKLELRGGAELESALRSLVGITGGISEEVGLRGRMALQGFGFCRLVFRWRAIF